MRTSRLCCVLCIALCIAESLGLNQHVYGCMCVYVYADTIVTHAHTYVDVSARASIALGTYMRVPVRRNTLHTATAAVWFFRPLACVCVCVGLIYNVLYVAQHVIRQCVTLRTMGECHANTYASVAMLRVVVGTLKHTKRVETTRCRRC